MHVSREMMKKRIAIARRCMQEAAARRAPKTVMSGGDGQVIREVPTLLYLNAVKVHGESPKDEGYWRDMDRLHPEIVVKQVSGKIMVGGQGQAPAAGTVQTRFGKARRYVYG